MDFIVPKHIEEYAASHTTPHARLLEELEEYTIANCAYPQMLVGRLEGALLSMLVRLSGARRILELGTFTGYSALCMAGALPADGVLLSCDINEEHLRIARSFMDRSPHGRKILLRPGPALETLRTFTEEDEFDIAFIDADKENYCNYYEAVLPLLRPDGLLVADNVLWSGHVLHPQKESDRVLARFNDLIQNDLRVDNVMLTVRDGVTLARKK